MTTTTLTRAASIRCRERYLDQARLHEAALTDAIRRRDTDAMRVYAHALSRLIRAIVREAAA